MAIETTFRNIPDTGSPSWKEPVETISDLPKIGNSVGDARVVENIDSIYIWDGTAWQLAAGGSGVADSFTIIQPDHGTTPVATSPSSTLTLTSSDGSVIITGDAVTDTINFQVPASAGGTVTSVGLSAPNIFTVSGSPVSTSGTLSFSLNSESTSTFLASPTGSSGVPTFRTIAVGDVPTLNQNTTGTASNITQQLSISQLQVIPSDTLLGNASSVSSIPTELTGTQVNTILPLFTSSLKGLTPLSGGGSVNYLRADGTWDAPPGATSGTVTSVGLSLPTGVFSVSGTPVTSSGTLTGNFLTQSPHTVFAGPGTGSTSSIPSFRLLNAADIAFPTSSVSQLVFVSQQGSDSTGNGTFQVPYASVSHALSVITDAAVGKVYGIEVLPGTYTDTTWTLKPFIFIAGSDFTGSTTVSLSGGITLSSTFSSTGGGAVLAGVGISNISIIGTNNVLTANLTAIGGGSLGNSAAIYLKDVLEIGDVTFSPRVETGDTLYINNLASQGTLTIHGGSNNLVIGPQFNNGLVFDDTNMNPGDFALLQILGGVNFSGVTITQAVSGTTVECVITASPNDGNLTVNGAGANLLIDAVSIPVKGSFTTTGSPTITYLDDASGVAYTPSTPGNWSPIPTLVQGALDTLAARSTGGIGTVTSVGLSLPSIFSVSGTPVLSSGTLTGTLNTQSAHTIFAGPSSGSSIPTFRALVSSDIPSLPYASSVLPPGQILVGNASSVASPVSMSVDGTLSSSGVLTITEAGGGTGTFKAGVTNVTQLGINNASAPATSPNFTFIDAIGNLATTSAVVQLTGYGTAGGNIGYVTKRARGTLASPAAVQASDKLALFSAYGYGTSQFPVASTGAVNFFANETFTNTSNATYFTIETTPTGSVTRTERVRVNSTGNVLIGTTTDVGGTSLLQVGSASSLQVNSSGNLVKVNNVPYSWPASQGSASTILKNDGSGNLSWGTTTSGISTLSVGTINGFAGSVASASTTPIINLSTTVTGIIKGNGTSLSAASVSDFPTLNQNTTGTASNITAPSNSTLVTLSSLSLPFLQTTGTVPINRGGTGQTTATTGFNALSPMTTSGDIIYGATTGSASRLAIGSNSQILTISGGLPTWQNASGGSGITQLTGDVLSGPGSGSQSASVAFVGGQSASVIASTTLKVLAATSSNTVNTLVLRDANGNTVINNFNTETVLANSGANIAMVASSSFLQRMTPGTLTPQVYTLPDATTLTNTRTFRFINNDTNGWYMTINDHSGTTLYTNNSSGVIDVQLIDNSTTAGTWNLLSYVPGFVTWNLGGLDLGIAGTITTNGDTTASLSLENGITLNNDEQTEVIRIVTMDGRHWDIIDNNGIQAQEIDERLFFDLDGNAIFSTGGFNDWDINVPHIETFNIFGASPSATPGTGLGTGGTVSVGGGGDTGFNVQTTAGTLPSVSAVIFSIVFVQPYNFAPNSITFSAANAAAAALSSTVFVDRSSITTTGFDFRCSVTGVSAASTPMWDFKVFE